MNIIRKTTIASPAASISTRNGTVISNRSIKVEPPGSFAQVVGHHGVLRPGRVEVAGIGPQNDGQGVHQLLNESHRGADHAHRMVLPNPAIHRSRPSADGAMHKNGRLIPSPPGTTPAR